MGRGRNGAINIIAGRGKKKDNKNKPYLILREKKKHSKIVSGEL